MLDLGVNELGIFARTIQFRLDVVSQKCADLFLTQRLNLGSTFRRRLAAEELIEKCPHDHGIDHGRYDWDFGEDAVQRLAHVYPGR